MNPLGISDDLNSLSENVYPNPVRDILNISSSFVAGNKFAQYMIFIAVLLFVLHRVPRY